MSVLSYTYLVYLKYLLIICNVTIRAKSPLSGLFDTGKHFLCVCTTSDYLHCLITAELNTQQDEEHSITHSATFVIWIIQWSPSSQCSASNWVPDLKRLSQIPLALRKWRSALMKTHPDDSDSDWIDKHEERCLSE